MYVLKKCKYDLYVHLLLKKFIPYEEYLSDLVISFNVRMFWFTFYVSMIFFSSRKKTT